MGALDSLAHVTLIDRARRRDEDAFARLVTPRLHGLLRIASAILGNESDAQDALQAALTNAWIHVSRIREPDRFDSWLTRILVNECRLTLRRRTATEVRHVRLDDTLAETASASSRPADRIEALTDRVALERAFERLSSDARSLLVLHHLERRTVENIAEVLKIPAGTVKSRLHAARRSLERELDKESR